MPTFLAGASVPATADATWSALSDVCAWPQWMPTVTRVQALDSPVLRGGARFRIWQPRLRPAEWRVTHLEPGRAFTWESRAFGLTTHARHRIVGDSRTATSVELQIAFSGWLAAPVAVLLGGLVRHYIRQEAAALERRLARRPEAADP